jgi:threonine dehydrogenase-like Zn-dependent dehydrogenase
VRALVVRRGRVGCFARPEPEAGPGDAIVRVTLAGICGTDLELLAGYKDFVGIPGHEFVGVVEEAEGHDDWVGRRVVADINIACGRCDLCQRAGPGHCIERRVLGLVDADGAMAERLSVPVANLSPVPDTVPDECAVFAEPLAAACRIVEQVRIDAGTRVVVVGAGRLGTLAALVLQHHGAQVEAVARSPVAYATLAAAGVIVHASVPLVEPGADVVVDASGTPSGLAAARLLVRPRGTLVLKSTCASPRTRDALEPTALVVDEITVVGSRCGPIDAALRLLAAGAVDPRPLVHSTHALSRGADAFAAAAGRGTLKVLLRADA